MSHITSYTPGQIRNHRAEAEAERIARYEMRHTPEAFLDKYFPRWRDGIPYGPSHGHEPCPCTDCRAKRPE